MKYIKNFEKLENNICGLKIGEYIIVKISYNKKVYTGDYLSNLLENKVGIVIDYHNSFNNIIIAKFFNDDNLNDDNLNDVLYFLNCNEIIFHTKNKHDIDAYIQSKKYNL